jgi:hypothetical protein
MASIEETIWGNSRMENKANDAWVEACRPEWIQEEDCWVVLVYQGCQGFCDGL